MISARPPGAPPASARTYLVPWRAEPVPQSEWIDVPATNAKFSPSGSLIYSFKGAALEAMKFDPKTKRIGQPFQAIREPNSQTALRPDDAWEIRDSGIVFTRSESKSSVWLMKMPE